MTERTAHDADHASTDIFAASGSPCHAAAVVGSVPGQALMMVLSVVDLEVVADVVVAASFSASVGAGVVVVVVEAAVAEEMVCS